MAKLEEYLLVVDYPEYLREFLDMKKRVTDYVLVIEQFQKLLGVYTTTEALAKIAVLMREEDTAERLLSKALGHLQTCAEAGSNELYEEIAEAFGLNQKCKHGKGHCQCDNPRCPNYCD